MIKEKKIESSEPLEQEIIIKKHRRVKDDLTAEKAVSGLSAVWESEPLRLAVSAAAAFILTGTTLGGIPSPMAVPLCAALGIGGNMAGILGIVLSSILYGTFAENTAELGAAVLMLAVKAVYMKRFSVKGSAALAGTAYGASSLLCVLYFGFSVSSLTAALFRTGICVFGAYFFGRAFSVPFSDKKAADPVPFFVVGIIFASAICKTEIFLFDLGRIAVCASAMALSKKFGSTGGAAAGTAGGLALILADSSFSRSAVFVSCAGLVSGLAAHKGKLGVSLTYIFASLVMAVLIGMPSGVERYIADSAAAGLIYFLIPERLYSPFLDRTDRHDRGCSVHNAASMGFAAGIIEGISGDIAAARRIYERKEQQHNIAGAVRLKVCSKCRSSGVCPAYPGGNGTVAKTETADLEAAAEMVSRKGAVSENDLSQGFSRCFRKADIVRVLNKENLTEERRRNTQRLTEGVCSSSVETLKAQCAAYEKMSKDALRYSGRMSVTAEDALRSMDVLVKSAAVYYDRTGRAYAEAFIMPSREMPYEKMTDVLSEITGTALDAPQIEKSEGSRGAVRCRWCRVPDLIAEPGIRSVPGGSEKSGDTAEFFTDGFGKYYMILADGMGSGRRAAEESCMAVSVVKRFIRSGTGAEAAVRYSNVLLSAVSGDEMFTTLDIMEFDSFSGKCVFYKLGAAESYIRCGNKVMTAENRALPIGIIAETGITTVTYHLNAGDCAVMITDGVEADDKYIREAVMNDTITPEMCAERIISAEDKKKEKKDDKTAAVIKIYKY